MRSLSRSRPDVSVGKGERVLAWAASTTGEVVAGTRDALYLVSPSSSLELVETRLPWEQIEAADWDRDSDLLRVSEVGFWGQDRVEHSLTLSDPRRLLELIRERVTASVVLQRHVPIQGRRGLRVIARRAPRGDRPLAWFYEYDEGVDPADPAVQQAGAAALAAARDEVEHP